jgi:2-oxoglutarate dehydrogenase E1 component
VWQIRGHNIAKLDPLGISNADLDSTTPTELLRSTYRFGEYTNFIST